jgi:predicted cobalt transporter CbtA
MIRGGEELMARKSAVQQHNQLMWLAIMVIALLLIPFLIGAIQKQSFRQGYAASLEKQQVEEWTPAY